uniref:Uncharacterized protein n=1 Tax=viral metagenome TaxID=1070528 RepID=A0A6C0LQW8_9ZZZZ
MTSDKVLLIIIMTIVIIVTYVIYKNNKSLTFYQEYSPKKYHFEMLTTFYNNEIMWMREYIIRVVYWLPSQEEIANRLYINAFKIANILDNIYSGSFESIKLILKHHIDYFLEVVTSIVTYDGDNFDRSYFAWQNNAGLFASKMNELNPSYSYDILKSLIIKYESSIESEIRANLNQKSALNEYDDVKNASTNIVSYLTNQ